MKFLSGAILLLFAGFVQTPAAPSLPLSPTPNPLLPVAVRPNLAPVLTRADGASALVYELWIQSLLTRELTLMRIEVLDAGSNAALAIYEDELLSTMLGRPGYVPPASSASAPASASAPQTAASFRPLGGSHRRAIGAGMSALVYFWIPLADQAAPRKIRHRLVFRATNPGDVIVDRIVEPAPQDVSVAAPVVIGPPLAGEAWAARFAGAESFHRRGVQAIYGSTRMTQRFAIDWGRFGPGWQAVKPQTKGEQNGDFYAHDEPVLAVADGKVAKTVDGIEENKILRQPGPPAPVTLPTLYGNFVVLEVAPGRFALYAHLRPGLPVEPGQRVRRGDVIGRLGNSGNSVGPHLHFQMMDGADPTSSDGAPFVIDRFEVIGRESLEQFVAGRWAPDAGARWQPRTNEMPVEAMVVRFPRVGGG